MNYDNLKIYSHLINLKELKYELNAFIEYKKRQNEVNWSILKDLIQEFVRNDLKTPFQQIYLCLKIYLTVPARQ